MHQTFVLPYLRTSPVQLSRRDIVLSMAESLTLRASVVYDDTPGAPALELSTTDPNGPAAQLVIWNDQCIASTWRDYGAPGLARGTMLQSVPGVPADAVGSWDFYLPTGTFYNFPPRCGWAILVLWNQGEKSSVLAEGFINFIAPFFQGTPLYVPPPYVPIAAPPGFALMTDDYTPILASDTLLVLET
jgi:hypothetical protein